MTELHLEVTTPASSLRHQRTRLMVGVASVVVVLLLAACASSPWYENPPPTPRAISPEVGASLNGAVDTVFIWGRTAETETYDFHIFNDDTDDIDQFMRVNLNPEQVCAGDTCSITLRLLLPESSRHAWRVRASNMAGKSAWTRSLFTFSR